MPKFYALDGKEDQRGGIGPIIPLFVVVLISSSVALLVVVLDDSSLLWFTLTISGILIFLTLVAPLCIRRPVLWLAVPLLLIALDPTSATYQYRSTGGTFSLFSRYLGGVISLWDVFLIVLVGFAILSSTRSRWWRIARPNRILIPAFLIVMLASLVGLAHATFWQYGFTDFRSVVQGTLPTVYFLLSYRIVQGILVRQKDLDLFLGILQFCIVATLAGGVVLFTLFYLGLFSASPGFLGIRIVLYQQLVFATLGVYWVFAKIVFGGRVSKLEWAILGLGVFFLLSSTRRLTLLLLVFNTSLIWMLARRYTSFRRRLIRITKVAVISLVSVSLAAAIFAPQLGEALVLVIKSLDITSEIGAEYAGGARMAEIQNLFLNMKQEAPWSYVWGMGIGTQWHEFVPTGMTAGTSAFISSLEKIGSRGWWPYFHIPYIVSIYRIGAVGTLLLWFLIGIWFIQWIRLLRRIPWSYRPVAMVMAIEVAQTVLALGDSVNSLSPAVAGMYLAVLEAMTWRFLYPRSKMATTALPGAKEPIRPQDEA